MSAGLSTPVSETVVDGSQGPLPRRRRSSQLPPRPLAVLEVINKRGKGIFSKHDEGALVRLCTCVESLLRRKAAEVSLLWSGMAERSLIRKGTGPGGARGGTNYARVESTIMRLYSKAPCPTEPPAVVGEKRTRRRSSAALHGGGGGGGGGVCHHHDRSASDSVCASAGGGDIGSVRRRGGSDRDVSGKAVVHEGAESGGGGGIDGIDRMLTAETEQEESELVDLSVNLFELSTDRLLSLVGRFFHNMRLTEQFQVCLRACVEEAVGILPVCPFPFLLFSRIRCTFLGRARRLRPFCTFPAYW